MKRLFQLILLLFVLSMTSCYYDEIYEVESRPPVDPETEVSFKDDIIPIFAAYDCTRCHNANVKPDMTSGNEYNALVPEYVVAENAEASELYTRLQGTNHLVSLSSNDLSYIEQWINQGAKNN